MQKPSWVMRGILIVLVLIITARANVFAQTADSSESFLWSAQIASYVGQIIAVDESAAKNKGSLLYAVYLSSPLNPFNSEEDFPGILSGLCAASPADISGDVDHSLNSLRKIPNLDGISRQFASSMVKDMVIPKSIRAGFDTSVSYANFGNSLYKMQREPDIGNYFSAVRAIPGAGLFRGHTLILESLVYGEKAIIDKQFNGPVGKYLRGEDSEIQQEINQYWKAEKFSAPKFMNNKSFFFNTQTPLRYNSNISSTLMNKSAFPKKINNIPSLPKYNRLSD